MPLIYAAIKNIFVNQAARFFTKEEQELIVNAIKTAEKNTSGEIRVHLESICWNDPIVRAQKVFGKLGMHSTKEQNGILIYIATESHKIAVIGDAGIHKKLGKEYWDKIVDSMILKFKEGQHAQGLADAIIDCGEQLKHYFPYASDDNNELNDSISFKS
jgi:uncharacterized membrane protein